MSNHISNQKHTLKIEYCKGCDSHSWCTHHNQQRYKQIYIELTKAIKKQLPEIQIIANVAPDSYVPIKAKQNKYFDSVGKKYVLFPAIGAFEIILDNNQIFSKKNTNAWPNTSEIVDNIYYKLTGIKRNTNDESKILSNKEEMSQKSQKQTIIIANNLLKNLDQNSTFHKKKRNKEITLAQHFKRYKKQKKLDADLEPLYAESQALKENKIFKITSEDINRLHEIWGKKQNLPSFIKNKAVIRKHKGKKQILIHLSSIQEESQLRETNRPNISQKKNSKVIQSLEMQFEKLENKLVSFENKVSEVNSKKYELQYEKVFGKKPTQKLIKIGHKNMKNHPLQDRIQQVNDAYGPQKLLKQIKQMNSKKKRKIDQYLNSSEQQKNEILQQIYGPQLLKQSYYSNQNSKRSAKNRGSRAKKLIGNTKREPIQSSNGEDYSQQDSSQEQDELYGNEQNSEANFTLSRPSQDTYQLSRINGNKRMASTDNNFYNSNHKSLKREAYTREKPSSSPKFFNDYHFDEKQKRTQQSKSLLYKTNGVVKNNEGINPITSKLKREKLASNSIQHAQKIYREFQMRQSTNSPSKITKRSNRQSELISRGSSQTKMYFKKSSKRNLRMTVQINQNSKSKKKQKNHPNENISKEREHSGIKYESTHNKRKYHRKSEMQENEAQQANPFNSLHNQIGHKKHKKLKKSKYEQNQLWQSSQSLLMHQSQQETTKYKVSPKKKKKLENTQHKKERKQRQQVSESEEQLEEIEGNSSQTTKKKLTSKRKQQFNQDQSEYEYNQQHQVNEQANNDDLQQQGMLDEQNQHESKHQSAIKQSKGNSNRKELENGNESEEQNQQQQENQYKINVRQVDEKQELELRKSQLQQQYVNIQQNGKDNLKNRISNQWSDEKLSNRSKQQKLQYDAKENEMNEQQQKHNEEASNENQLEINVMVGTEAKSYHELEGERKEKVDIGIQSQSFKRERSTQELKREEQVKNQSAMRQSKILQQSSKVNNSIISTSKGKQCNISMHHSQHSNIQSHQCKHQHAKLQHQKKSQNINQQNIEQTTIKTVSSQLHKKRKSSLRPAAIIKQFYGPQYKNYIREIHHQLSALVSKSIQKKVGGIYINELYANKCSNIFEPNSIQFHNVVDNSGLLGNVLKIIKILCLRNQYLIIRLFENPEMPETSAYGVWLCNNYRWQLYIVNKPIEINENGNPKYLHHKDHQLWPIILAQALADMFGGYENLSHISICTLFHVLTGTNYLNFKIKEDPSKNHKLLNFITTNEKKNFIIVAQKRIHVSLAEQQQSKNESPVFYILSQKILNEQQILLRMKKDNSDAFWIKLKKFVSEFSAVHILQLRINHNFNHLLLQECTNGNFTILELNFKEEAFGCVAFSTDGKQSDFKLFLYKEQDDNVLRLVGQAKQKSKNSIFFDCYFEQGKYLLFADLKNLKNRLAYVGEGCPEITKKQEIQELGLKNKYTQYVPISSIPTKQQKQMPKFLTMTKKSQNQGIFGLQSSMSSPQCRLDKAKLKHEFIDYLIKH